MRPFIIDTDTASDDAIAIMMMLKHESIDVKAITTVAGNVEIEQTTKNALFITEQCNKDVPTYIGMKDYLLRPFESASFVHGNDGMGDVDLIHTNRKPNEGHAIDIIPKIIKENAGEINLLTIGPLTNIAMVLLKEPELAKLVKTCYVMGGACSVGNITPVSEFNVWADPEAAKIVFESGINIHLITWDAALEAASLDYQDLENLRNLDTNLAKIAVDIQAVKKEWNWKENGKKSVEIADPLAAAIAINDTCIKKSITVGVKIICEGDINRGQTVIDYNNQLPDANTVKITYSASKENFIKMLKETLI